jgi:hypothetical protein
MNAPSHASGAGLPSGTFLNSSNSLLAADETEEYNNPVSSQSSGGEMMTPPGLEQNKS